MKYYLAPMEGLTGYVFRNAYHACFSPADKYFTPFLSPKKGGRLSSREKNDICPEHNQKIPVVPQILTNRWEDFLETVKVLEDYGYEEVNLNLGCPSGTVTSKYKGAGFLAIPDELDRFLDEVCKRCEISISVKTRIGVYHAWEFEDLIAIYNRYPLKELIVHPRLLKDYYKNTPDMDSYRLGEEMGVHPICYNGDLFSRRRYEDTAKQFKRTQAVMLGRGILANPGLLGEIKGKGPMDKGILKEFHQRVYEGYQREMSGERNVLFKMKELMSYICRSFVEPEKYAKQIKKAQTGTAYQAAVEALFEERELKDGNQEGTL